MKISFTVENEEGIRIDKFLSTHLSEYSRTQCQKIIEYGAVSTNDKLVISPSSKVHLNDEVRIDFEEPERRTVDIKEIYTDNDIVVVDKPAGLLTVDDTFLSQEPTVEDSLLRKYKTLHIVHRLDKETSGVLISARNKKTFKELKEQFRNRSTKKHYIALVKGHLEHNEAVINKPITRDSKHPIKWRVGAEGRKSITSYKVRSEYDNHSLLDVFPKTGRTHQIRVHLSSIGNPIIGDLYYGKEDQSLKRHFLHAHKLTIELESSVKEFTSPLPKELNDFLNKLV